MKKSELRQIIKNMVLNEIKSSTTRTNFRSEPNVSGVINHKFDTIDTVNIDKGYKVKIISTYAYRDPKSPGYSKSTNSKENPGIADVKTTLIDPLGKPIKNYNFTGSNQWGMLNSDKKDVIAYIKNWWMEKMKKMGL